MFKNILLSNIEIDPSNKDYRRLLLLNLAFLIALAVFTVFSMVNFFIRDNILIGFIELFFILFVLYGFMKLRLDKNIQRCAIFATFLLFSSLLIVHFLFEFKEGITYWALLFPFIAINIAGAKKGLIFTIIFNLIVYIGAYYYWQDGNMAWISYTRFVLVSLIITALVYFYEVSISSSFEKQAVLNESLMQRVDEIRLLAITDSLTTLYNKRHFDTVLSDEFNRAKRAGEHFILGIIDVDNFKLFNDTYGHNNGNEALERVGIILNQQTLRSGDYAFRIGGEEFAVILQSSSCEDCYDHFDNLRKKIEEEKIEHINNKPYGFLTVSIGVVTAKNYKKIGIVDVYKEADKNLYSVKKSGRNGVKHSIL